ncbi:MAG: hypothetical protein OXC57_02720 [Rhodobacteraceae bacterium]|nr:hypothetical protein [Paracoccaceae bacterium]
MSIRLRGFSTNIVGNATCQLLCDIGSNHPSGFSISYGGPSKFSQCLGAGSAPIKVFRVLNDCQGEQVQSSKLNFALFFDQDYSLIPFGKGFTAEVGLFRPTTATGTAQSILTLSNLSALSGSSF